MDIQLDPPIGTCYFRSYQSTITSGGFYPVNLTVTFYIYVTLARPDQDFTANGGKVYIVAVYNGWGTNRGVNTTIRFGFEDDSGLGLTRSSQLPITGSGTESGDTNTYAIDFAQSMSMFNNSGNSQFTFSARYKRSFSVTGFTQTELQPSTSWGWKLTNEDTSQQDQKPNLYGLHVFETNKLGVANCALFYDVYWTDHALFRARKVETLDFSAETMAGTC